MITREVIQTLLATCCVQEDQAKQIHRTTGSVAEFHQSHWEAFSYSYQRHEIEQIVASYSQEFWEYHLFRYRTHCRQDVRFYNAIVKNPPVFGASHFALYKRAGMSTAYQWMYQQLCTLLPASPPDEEHHEIIVELGALERSRIERFGGRGGRSGRNELFLPSYIERREACSASSLTDELICCFVFTENEHLHILACTYGPPVTPMTVKKHFCRSIAVSSSSNGSH